VKTFAWKEVVNVLATEENKIEEEYEDHGLLQHICGMEHEEDERGLEPTLR
jgi:hypothetical protein